MRLVQQGRAEALCLPAERQQSRPRTRGGAGITIFTRSSSGIAITNEGRQLLKLSNKLLRDADYIDEYFQRSAEGPKPSFFISSQHYDFVVSAFEEFVGGLDADRYTLGLNQNQTSVVIESVRKQSSDLGVIFLSDVNRRHMERVLEDNNLAFHRLVQARPHAFLSVTHPLAGRRSIRTDELMEYPCIVYEQTADSPGFFSEEMMLPNFYPPKVVYISDLYVSTALMRSCNAYDVGTGVISPRLAREVACVPIETEDTVDIGWISIRGRALRPIEEAFLACMKRHILAAQGQSFFLWAAIGIGYFCFHRKYAMLGYRKSRIPAYFLWRCYYEPAEAATSRPAGGQPAL